MHGALCNRSPFKCRQRSSSNRASLHRDGPVSYYREYLAVGLEGQCKYTAVHAGGRIKSSIRRTGRLVVGLRIHNLHQRVGRQTQRRIGRIGQRHVEIKVCRRRRITTPSLRIPTLKLALTWPAANVRTPLVVT